MKKLTLIFTVIVAILFLGCNKSSVDKKQMVNPIIGDISYESKFGHKPNETNDNNLRIKTHLEYVENLLRKKDVSNLSIELKMKRNHLLDLLHNYWTNEKFPKNYDYSDQRKPCFIDKDETICAVGYLIEQTTSRNVANAININHKYDELLKMNDKTVDNWILNSGLTKEECAMIQPTYGPSPVYTYNYITPAYGISSSILGGLNLSLNTINGIQIGKGKNNNAVPVIGLITGIGQIALGSGMYPKERSSWNGMNMTNESQRTLSMINIGLGSTTMILSTWNLLTNKRQKSNSTSWNFYSFPTQNKNLAFGLNMTRKF
jgi:hypothetical protein